MPGLEIDCDSRQVRVDRSSGQAAQDETGACSVRSGGGSWTVILVGKRYVLLDRDPLYTEAFRRILGQGGVKAMRLPARSPNLNAFAERFVLSIKTECLDRLVPLGEAYLRRAILQYTNHYHEERNHQGLDNDLISPAKTTNGVGNVSRRERLGGLLSFYYREAA